MITIMIFQLHAQDQMTFKIILNKSNSVKSISSDELKKIFLKKETKWDDDTKIYPVDFNESSKTRINFTNEIHGKKVSAIKAYGRNKYSPAGAYRHRRSLQTKKFWNMLKKMKVR